MVVSNTGGRSKSVEAGRTVKDVCREAAISEASYYNWKAKYGGMEAADIKKMKDLEDENRRLKQMDGQRTRTGLTGAGTMGRRT